MVGDGLNDAAALASAHVSMAADFTAPISPKPRPMRYSSATRLAPVVEALSIARQARRAMMQNLALAILYNVVAVPLRSRDW